MRIPSLLLLVVVFVLAYSPGPAYADSSISVGNLERKVVDSVTVLDDWFDKPALEVYLFARQLTEQEKTKVALNDDSMRRALGPSPIAEIIFFMEKGSTDCSKPLSYTAVFRKSEALPIPVRKEPPINWVFSSNNLSNYGVSFLDCELRDQGRLSFKVKHFHNLDKEYEERFFKQPLLNADVPSLLFSWNLSMTSSIIDKKKIFVQSDSGSKTIRLKSTAIKDTDAVYSKKYHALFVRLYKHVIPSQDRGLRAPKEVESELGTISLTFDPAAERTTLASCYISFNIKQDDGSILGHTVDCKGDGHTVEWSAGFEKGKRVALNIKGAAEPDNRVKRPAVAWDLQVETHVEGVFEE